MAERKLKIDKLRREIEYHNFLYYVEAKPEITDFEYDSVYAQLVDLESKHPELITADSPTQKVGAEPLTGFRRVRHTVPMLSLDNTYSHEELKQFHKRVCKILGHDSFEYHLEPKIDGVGISLRYERGILTRALTRGNGQVGEDVTENVRTIKSIPSRLLGQNPPEIWEPRGEIFMAKEEFKELNSERKKKGLSLFANPRNTAAGTLKLLDSRVVSKRSLDALFYTCGEISDLEIQTQSILVERMKNLGLKIPDFHRLCTSIEMALKSVSELQEIRHDFPYELDGAVIKVNRFDFHKTLGFTAKSPRWAIAYKYETEKAITKLNNVVVQVGRTGVLTPVAELTPVFLSGSKVSRATLHNFDEIKRKDIQIGDFVEIEKAGEIIPAVIRPLKEKRTGEEKTIVRPRQCPICSSQVSMSDSEIAIRCENAECPKQVKERLIHYSCRTAMDIESLGWRSLTFWLIPVWLNDLQNYIICLPRKYRN